MYRLFAPPLAPRLLAAALLILPLAPHAQAAQCPEEKPTDLFTNMLQARALEDPARQARMLRAIEDAFENGCPGAFEAILNVQAFELQTAMGTERYRQQRAQYDDKILAILQKSLPRGEGRFEFGGFLLHPENKHHSVAQAVSHFEQAAREGDRRAIEFLSDAYEDGSLGMPVDKERAAYWKARLQP